MNLFGVHWYDYEHGDAYASIRADKLELQEERDEAIAAIGDLESEKDDLEDRMIDISRSLDRINDRSGEYITLTQEVTFEVSLDDVARELGVSGDFHDAHDKAEG